MNILTLKKKLRTNKNAIFLKLYNIGCKLNET